MAGVIPHLPGMCLVGPHLVGEAYPDVVRQSVSRSHHKLQTLQIPPDNGPCSQHHPPYPHLQLHNHCYPHSWAG